MLPALLVCLACGAGGDANKGDKSASALATVSREVPSQNPAGISSSDLAATAIPRGRGIVVYVKNHTSPRFVWVVLDGQVYACNNSTKNLTPNWYYCVINNLPDSTSLLYAWRFSRMEAAVGSFILIGRQ